MNTSNSKYILPGNLATVPSEELFMLWYVFIKMN